MSLAEQTVIIVPQRPLHRPCDKIMDRKMAENSIKVSLSFTAY